MKVNVYQFKPERPLQRPVLATAPGYTRTTAVSGAARAPYCLMGTCFECLMEIDGVENRQACMTIVVDGMTVNRQNGKREMP
ncbi:MAG: (2Fe-2S)-binding protein [Candidatus Latescibacterota bacterium]